MHDILLGAELDKPVTDRGINQTTFLISVSDIDIRRQVAAIPTGRKILVHIICDRVLVEFMAERGL